MQKVTNLHFGCVTSRHLHPLVLNNFMVILALNATERHNVMRLHHSVLSSYCFRGVILVFCRRKQWAKIIIVNKSSKSRSLWSTVKQVHAGLRHVRIRVLLMSILPGRAGGILNYRTCFSPHSTLTGWAAQNTNNEKNVTNVRRITLM